MTLVDYEKYAKVKGIGIDREMEPHIVEGLKRNLAVHGFGYCPCMLARTVDTICPCTSMKETGHCHCGLFIKE